MKSTEKVNAYLDEIAGMSDSDLASALPFRVGAGAIRMGLDKAQEMLPTGPEELDELLERGIAFLTSLLTDDLDDLDGTLLEEGAGDA